MSTEPEKATARHAHNNCEWEEVGQCDECATIQEGVRAGNKIALPAQSINWLALEVAESIQAATHCSEQAMHDIEKLMIEFANKIKRQAIEP